MGTNDKLGTLGQLMDAAAKGDTQKTSGEEQLAHDMDMFGRPRTVEERLAAVDAVTPKRIAEYLERWPLNVHRYLVSVGPRSWPTI